MKCSAVTSLISLAASLLIAPVASAAGIIMVDPVAGAVPAIAIMPPVRPPVPVLPPVRPPVRPPGHRPPAARPPLLKGTVSFGLHLQSEAIKVDINDQVAKTYITQVFVNDTDRNLAGTYLFPLPEDTTFSSFSLHIDGKPVEGRILEANEARQQYEEIVRRMVDPGLLEYADYKTVRARIFPIPAHGTKTVELEYTQVLKAENGMLKYRFPLKSDGQTAPADEIKVDVKLASKQGLRTIWSPSHTISAKKDGDHLAKIAYLAHDSIPDKDFLLYYSVSDKELAANLLTHRDTGEEGYFLLTLTPPVETKQIVGKDLVLVADTSGSMQGEKMTENKRALKYVVNALNGNDRFNIVQFNTDVEKFKAQLVPASAENKKAALAFIDELEARGGTNIGDALRTGATLLSQASDRPAYLVMITDGEPTVGETSVANLIKAVPAARDLRLFDFGVGYDVNTKLLNKLAEQHHGTSQYIDPDEDMETALSSFYQKIKSPILTDIAITYDGVQAKNVYPKEVKDLFAGSQALLIGRYKGSGNATVKLTGKVNGVSRAYSFPLTFSAEETGHTYLPRLWAMRRIGYLTEVAQDNGDNREVVDEIVALSKKYGIISAYTSFLVTDPSENHRLPTPMPVPARPSASTVHGLPGAVAANSTAAGAEFMASAPSGGGGGWTSMRFRTLAPRGRRELQAIDDRPIARDLREAPPALMGLPSAGLDSFSFGAAGFGGTIEKEAALKSELASRMATLPASGKKAVEAAKLARRYQTVATAADERLDKDTSVKSVEDKTFYLKDGFWTDSSFEPGKSAKPEIVPFGSSRYFELFRSLPGISKYLAVGQKVILVYKGRCYKIVEAAGATG